MSKAFVRNSFFGTVSSVSFALGNFLSTLLVARLLGVEGLGAYAFAVWIVSIATAILGVGLPFTLSRYLPELDAARGARIASALLRPMIGLGLAPLFAALCYALWMRFAEPTQAHHFIDPSLLILVGASSGFQTLGDFAKGYLRGRESLDQVARLTSLAVLAQLGVTAVCGFVFGVHGAMLGYLVGAVIPTTPLIKLWRETPQIDGDVKGRIIRYAKFRWASEIAGSFVYSRIEVLFLQLFWGATATGMLTASFTLANLAVQGPLMLTWGLLPHLSAQFARGDFDSVNRSFAIGTRVMAFMILPACFGFAAITPELLTRLYGPNFSGATSAATLLVAAAAIPATATVGSNVIYAVERSDVDFRLGLLGAVLSILGGLFLIAPFGAMGAVCSRALTQLIVISAGVWFLQKRLKLDVPYRALLRLALCALLCAATARAVITIVPGLAGVIIAIGAGAVVYFIAVRAVSALDPLDIEKLRGLADHLPRPAAPFARRLARAALG